MKYFQLSISALLLLLIHSSCNRDIGNQIEESDESALREMKEVFWPKAYAEQDTLLLDRILGDDFQMIDGGGTWTTKTDELNWIKKHASNPDSFFYEIRRLDVLDNGTAIICGKGHILNEGVRSSYHSSNVLIKRNGVWEAVLSHVSGYRVETSE